MKNKNMLEKEEISSEEVNSKNSVPYRYFVADFDGNQKVHAYTLIVCSPFRDYQKGQRITDHEEIEKILNSHEEAMTTKVLNQ